MLGIYCRTCFWWIFITGKYTIIKKRSINTILLFCHSRHGNQNVFHLYFMNILWRKYLQTNVLLKLYNIFYFLFVLVATRVLFMTTKMIPDYFYFAKPGIKPGLILSQYIILSTIRPSPIFNINMLSPYRKLCSTHIFSINQ